MRITIIVKALSDHSLVITVQIIKQVQKCVYIETSHQELSELTTHLAYTDPYNALCLFYIIYLHLYFLKLKMKLCLWDFPKPGSVPTTLWVQMMWAVKRQMLCLLCGPQ